MDIALTPLGQDDLLTELDDIERAIARSRTFDQYTDAAGQPRERVSPELLALAEREQLIVSELRRRRDAARPAA